MKVPTIEPLEARIAPAVLSISAIDGVNNDGVKDEGSIAGSSTSFSFKITLDAAEPQDVTVIAGLVDGTAKVADGDFNAFSQTITIPKGQLEAIFSVPVKQDTVIEADETFSVVLSSPSVNAAIGQGTATATIKNDDFPKISIQALDPSLPEGSATGGLTNFRFDVVLDRVATEDVTVQVSIKDGTATVADGDFDALTQMVTIPAGELKAATPVSFAIKQDTVVELNETFSVELSSPSANAVIGTATAGATIANDDPPSLSIENATVIEGAAGETPMLQFTVKLSSEAAQDVTFDWSTGLGGSATNGTDYTAVGLTTVTIPAGQKEASFSVPIIGDNIDEVDETVQVSIRNAKMGTESIVIQGASGGTKVATGTIQNDDLTITLSGPASLVEGNSPAATFAEYVVTQSGTSTHAVQVVVELINGTAKLGTDFSLPTSLTVTIPAGATTGTVRVPITVDNVFEADETFQVRVVSVANAVRTGAEFVETTIVNDDTAPTLKFSQITPLETTEGNLDGQFSVVVSLSAAAGKDVTFNWSTVNGTAIGGLDFEAVTNQSATILAGQTSTTLVLTKKGDTIHETSTVTDVVNDVETTKRAETFSIALSDATNATIDPAAGSRTVRLLDDDAAPILSIADTKVFEGEGANPRMGFVVSITNGVTADQPIQFNWAAGLGSATPGVDYEVVTSSPATLAAGAESVTLFLNVNDDLNNEIDETVLVNVGTPILGGQTNLTLAKSQATGTILNDDLSVSITALTPAVIEGGAETTAIAKYRVSIPTLSAHDVSVTVQFDAEASTATLGTDFTLPPSTTVTIPAGQTSVDFDVTIKGDTAFEANETIALKLVNPVNVAIGAGTAVATIENDDTQPTLAIQDRSIEEGDDGNTVMNFTVKLSNAAGEDITFDWSTVDGTAIGGIDFSKVVNRQGVILKGQDSATISVAVSGDFDDEADEAFTVVVSNAMLGATPIVITDNTALGTIENDDLSVRIAGGTVTEGNAGTTNLDFAFSIPQVSEHDVTVTFKVNEGTAKAGSDYDVPLTLTATIPAGQMLTTISIAVKGDVLDELNETFAVELTDATNAKLGVSTATGTILDDDAAPILSIDSVSQQEGGSGTTDFVFTVKLKDANGVAVASGQDVKVLATPTGGTATAGTDFIADAQTLTIPAGQTEATFIVKVNGDTAFENDENFTVVLSNATGATIATGSGTGAGTILNDDATPSLTITSPTAAEPTGSISFTINLSAASGLPVTFTATTLDGTALAGKDYTSKTQNFTIAPGQTSATFTVPIANDALFEPAETFNVNVTNVTNATMITPSGQGTITNVEDLEPTVTVSDVTVAEGDSGEKEVAVTVSLSHLAGSDVTFDWSVITDGSSSGAIQGSDFTLVSDPNTQAVIPAGQSSVTLKFKVTGDTADELDETFSVKVANPKVGTDPLNFTNGKDTGVVKLLNDDLSVSVNDVSVVEGDAGTVDLVFTITLSASSQHGVTVNYTTQDGTAISTGDIGFRDFEPANDSVVFAPGELTKLVTVQVRGDVNFDGTDQFKLLLTTAANARIADGEGTGTIIDDDARPVVTIGAATPVVEDAGTTATPPTPGTTKLEFTVNLDHASDETVEVSVSTVNGTALAGSDFNAITNQRVVFAPGETTKTVTVTVLNDSVYEADETFDLVISDPLRATLGAVKAQTATILKDEDAPPQLQVLSQTILEGNDGERFLSFIVQRAGATNEEITFLFETLDGTIPGQSAVAGEDFEAKSETITMLPGESTKTVLVKVVSDSSDERDEQFKVRISNPTDAVLATGTDGTATGTILNDDLTVSLSQGVVEVLEGNSGQSDLVFTVNLSAVSTHATEVTYTVAGGTAGQGTDYLVPTVLSITIPAGAASGQIRIPIIGDTVAEVPETLSVTLTGAKDAELATTDLTATGTILNDDAALSISNATRVEGTNGSEMMRFTVTLDAPFSYPVTVNYVTANGSAVAGSDYTSTQGTLTFALGETSQFIDVPILGDTFVEGDETFTVTLSNATGASILDGAGTGTIQDDESFLNISDASIEEGDSGTRTMTFTISRSPGSAVGATVRVSTLDGTAISTGLAPDFVAKSEVITFAANETSKAFSVVVNGDRVFELGPQAFSVVLSEATGALILDGQATGTIANSTDEIPTIRIDDASIVEGDSGTKALKFTVSLSEAADGEVAFDFATALSAGGADSADFASLGQTFVIPAGQKTFDVEIQVNGDTDNEVDEAMLGRITAARFTPTGQTTSTAVAIADGEAVGTIRNDDLIVSIASTAAGTEGNGPGTTFIPVRIDLRDANGDPADSTEDVLVTLQFAGGSATLGTDFTVPPLTATIVAGQTFVDVLVPVTGDLLHEANEMFTVTLASATNAQLGATTSTVTITDNDDAPTISVADVSVNEGTSAVFTVELKDANGVAVASGRDTIVKWVTEFVPDSAEPGDFQHFGAVQTLVIPAGQTSGKITIGTTNDATDELDETFKVRILSTLTENATIPTDVVATGTILKNDLGAFSIGDASVIEGSSGTKTLAFTVTRSASNLPGSVNYVTGDGSAKATAGAIVGDYESASGTLNFAAGESSQTIFITVNGDNTSEIDETFFVGLSGAVDGTIADSLAAGKILNDEVTYSIEFDDVGGSVTEENGTGQRLVRFYVVRTGATDGALNIPGSVFYRTDTNSAAGAVQATPSIDFTSASGSVSFTALANGTTQRSQRLEVAITSDALPEGDETFLIKLSNAINGQLSSTESEQVVEILDNDEGNLPRVVIENGKLVEGPDGATTDMIFKVRLVDNAGTTAQAAGGPITVSYSTADLTAFAGTDYLAAAANATITFAAGETEKDIRIPILGDSGVEADETFSVSILGAIFKVPGTTTEIPFASTKLPETPATGTITNDDLTITLAPLSQFVEGNGLNDISFVAQIAQASTHDVSFTVKTNDGTAVSTAAGDFVALDRIVTIPAGMTEVTFTVAVNGDLYAEADETFTLLLSDSSNALLGTTSRVVTILNDDAAPSLSVGDASIIEGDSGQPELVFTVVLSGATLAEVTVDYATEDDTAKSSGALVDYLARSGSLRFAASSSANQSTTFSVPILGDTWREVAERFNVHLSNAQLGGSSTGVTITDGTGVGQINDNGDTTLGVIVHDARAAEGTSGNGVMQFTIETTAPVTGTAVTLRADTRIGTASAADFTALQNHTLTIAVGQSQTTVPVTTTGDNVFEAAEHLLLDITGFDGSVKAVNGSATTATASGVILNDDVKFVPGGRDFQYVDADGDLVTVKFSKGTLRVQTGTTTDNSNHINFSAVNALGGRTLDLINLAIDEFAFEGVSISVTAKPQILVTGETLGDGKANVGSLVAASLNADLFQISSGIGLGKVSISGNLGQLITGSTKRPLGVSFLEVGSFGSDSNQGSVVLGPIAKMVVHGDFMGNLRMIGDAAAQPIPGGGVGRIGNLVIEGMLKGGTNEGSGRITFTGGIGTATIGGIEGGSGRASGTIVSFSDEFNTRIGKLTVLGDIAGGSGVNSGLVEADSIGSLALGKAGRSAAQQVSGSLVGGAGELSGVVSANILGKVVINGDIRGGSGNTSGYLVANQTFGSVKLTGSLIGGTAAAAGLIRAAAIRGPLAIEGSIEGGSGDNSGLVFVEGFDIGLVTLPGGIKSITLGKAGVDDSGNLVGGKGAGSGRIDVNGNVTKFLAYGDIEGGKGANSGSLLVGNSTTPTILKSAVIKGSIIGGSTDPSGVTGGVGSLVGSGYVEAHRIGAITVGGQVVSGENNGTGLAKSGGIHAGDSIGSLKVGSVSGNEMVPVVISAMRSIGKATFGGDVAFLELLAGYSAPTSVTAPRGVLQDAGASIGSVVVAGTFTASSIVAGVHAGSDGKFGTADDLQTTNGASAPGNQQLISKIASVVLKQIGIPADVAGTASYGIVAEHVKSLKIDRVAERLIAGPSNDGPDLLGPVGSKLQIFEI